MRGSAAQQRLGQTAAAEVTAKRIDANPEILDERHGKNADALIEEVRQWADQMDQLRRTTQLFQ